MKRRTFIVSAVCVAGASGLALKLRSAAWSERDVTLEIALSVADGSDAELVGRDYLAQAPEESSKERLVELIFPELLNSAQPPPRAKLIDGIARLVREDFEAQRTVTIDGWTLSRTEARLCALTTFR